MSQPDAGPDHGSPPSTPRWVKVFVIIALVLILLVVVVVVTDIGGPHGPGRHIPSGNSGDTPSGDAGQTLSAEQGSWPPATEPVAQQP